MVDALSARSNPAETGNQALFSSGIDLSDRCHNGRSDHKRHRLKVVVCVWHSLHVFAEVQAPFPWTRFEQVFVPSLVLFQALPKKDAVLVENSGSGAYLEEEEEENLWMKFVQLL